MFRIKSISSRIAHVVVAVALLSTGSFAVSQSVASADPIEVPVVMPEVEDVEIYACPDRIFMVIPRPVDPDGFSALDPLQPGWMNFEIFESPIEPGDSYLEQPTPGSGYQMQAVSEMWWFAPVEPWSIGEELDFTLRGYIYSDVVDFEDYGTLNVSTTVVDPSFAEGNGTASDPYIVASVADLSRMRCHDDKHFQLGNDVNLTGINWMPISADWAGTLDGDGHSISGLTINRPGLIDVGLFGRVRRTVVQNLTIVAPVVVGGLEAVGVVFGTAEFGSRTFNVHVTDADVEGFSKVGLMVGQLREGSKIVQSSVEGSIVAKYPISVAPVTGRLRLIPGELYNVGGMVGYDTGNGTGHLRNSVNVSILVTPGIDVMARGEEWVADDPANRALDFYSDVKRIGGYSGENNEDVFHRYLEVDSDITVEFYDEVRSVGGLIGDNEDEVSWVSLDSSVRLVFLGRFPDGSTAGIIRRVGGAIGYTDDIGLTFANVKSEILIEKADGTNNSLGIDISEEHHPLEVQQVGGAVGEIDDDTFDAFVRVHTDIEVRDAWRVTDVAGYVGKYDDDQGLGNNDLLVSGSIRIEAGGLLLDDDGNPIDDDTSWSSIRQVGGFANLTAGGLLSGQRMFAATSIELIGDEDTEVTDVYPFVGSSGYYPIRQRVEHGYWDSTLNPSPNADGYPGTPATTAQLQSRSFLESIGMDFAGVWKLSGGYPELQEPMYLWEFRTVPVPVPAPAPTPLIPAQITLPESSTVGGTVLVSGLRLNLVSSVSVGGIAVGHTMNPDGTLGFVVPALSPGDYPVVFSSAASGSAITQILRVVAASPVAILPPRTVTATVAFDDNRTSSAQLRRLLREVLGVAEIRTATSAIVTGYRSAGGDPALSSRRARTVRVQLRQINPRLVVTVADGGVSPAGRLACVKNQCVVVELRGVPLVSAFGAR